jgi:phosphatidate cytidylyltransferase
MQLVISTIVFFVVIGGVGMYFGNRKVDKAIARQRWTKYVAYILITTTVVLSIWFHFFSIPVILIIAAGYYELTGLHRNKRYWQALIVYSIIAAGFIFYALKFKRDFQFFIYLQVLAFDAFSQVTGQLFGKTLIAPKISPSKTLEGLTGGVCFCILSSALTSGWMNISIGSSIAVGLFTSLTGFAGDMLASFYKRIADIKDYSNLLPGQGGFLDRFDSFMMSAFCYSVVYLAVPGTIPI